MSDINVLSELERIGWEYEFAGDDEVKVRCPFHDDKSPSNHINLVKRLFKCQTSGCDAKGDFISFLSRALNTTRTTVLADLGTRYALDETKSIEPEVVERYHAAIWQNQFFIKELHSRGIDEKLIRKYRIGFYRDRITIPIPNEAGTFVNVRRYLPGAPGADKMRNTKGRGRIRLFPIKQLSFDTVCVCAGELKAILAAHQLNRHGIGAISATGGEGNWDASFNGLFKGKTVYVIFDVDEEGQKGAKNVLTQLYRAADCVHNIVLPLDRNVFPHGDINDYCGPEINKRLKPLIDKAEEWEPSLTKRDWNTEPIDVELNVATHASSAGKRIRLKAVASAAQEASYTIPKTIAVYCPRDQNECSVCPVFLASENDRHHIPSESPAILEMINSPKSIQRDAIMAGLGVPLTCKPSIFEPEEFYNIEDVRISPGLEISSRAIERVMQPAYCIGDQIELNATYELVGRMHPHPKTQQSTLLISKYTATKDALSCYSPDDVESLTIFQPKSWTIDSMSDCLNTIYDDLGTNITRIFQRQQLHLAIDLAYHSPLLVPFDGKVIKGWVEVLVVGDSSQGKSDTAMGLMEHYGLGEKVECKNATVAGLLGGLQSMGGRWFVTWGVIPTHDQRLVVLEELKGTSPEVISKLTDMRSSGIAEIPKIEKRRTRARTRLIALSNARSDRQLSSYNFGVDAIKELIGALEDIRRFDYCLLVSERDIDPEKLNQLRRSTPPVPHQFTSKLCHELILWAWTLDPEQIKWEDAATIAILDESQKLCSTFTEAIPIVDKGSMRYKLARLAASLACRTFSNEGKDLLIRKCHVDYIARLLHEVYSSNTFGYADFTESIRIKNTLTDEKVIKRQLKQVPFPVDFAKQILHTDYIELTDIQDWCGWERREAQVLLSVFVRKHALVRQRRAYRKTPAFITMLKMMLEGNEFPNRPDHIEEEF